MEVRWKKWRNKEGKGEGKNGKEREKERSYMRKGEVQGKGGICRNSEEGSMEGKGSILGREGKGGRKSGGNTMKGRKMVRKQSKKGRS